MRIKFIWNIIEKGCFKSQSGVGHFTCTSESLHIYVVFKFFKISESPKPWHPIFQHGPSYFGLTLLYLIKITWNILVLFRWTFVVKRCMISGSNSRFFFSMLPFQIQYIFWQTLLMVLNRAKLFKCFFFFFSCFSLGTPDLLAIMTMALLESKSSPESEMFGMLIDKIISQRKRRTFFENLSTLI